MVKLIEEIYGVLDGLEECEVHFDLLPSGIDTTKTHIIYEINESGSLNTLDKSDLTGSLDLVVKMLSRDPLILYQMAEMVKLTLLNMPFNHNELIHYNGSVPIFRDNDLDTSQYTLRFTVYR